MKAISLHQPYASAIAVGAKRVETRSWPTSHRGPIAIHAAKRCIIDELIGFQSSWTWCGALRPLGIGMAKGNLWEVLPFGAIVAIAELVDCRPTESFTIGEIRTCRLPEKEIDTVYAWTESQMGDFSLGRFGWVLDNIRALPEPIPCRGYQRIFNVDLPTLEAINQ